ncbi:beta-1,6-galactofuranosyltransferase, partial [Liquorilactobacillus uvarum]
MKTETFKYVITACDKESNHAGPKAKEDIARILVNQNYQENMLKIPSRKYKKILYFLHSMNKELNTIKDGIVVLQYPIYSLFLTHKIIKKLRSEDNKLILVVHDIESLRIFEGVEEDTKKELEILNSVDGLVVHNQSMVMWLKLHGVRTKMVTLKIFDYLSSCSISKPQKGRTGIICYAGNLYKAKFLKEFKTDNTVAVFGPNPADNYPSNIEYRGQYAPEKLPEFLVGDYGLVWDGPSENTCDGVYGHYLKYNSPHKVSLYLS